MRKELLQELSDDILIDGIASEIEITKTAGLFETLGLDEAASSIKSTVKSEIAGLDSTEDVLGAVGNLLVTGTLFKVHPVLGFAYAIAEALGVDIGGMVTSVIGAIKQKGGPLLESEFNPIAKSAMLSPQVLIKEAQWRRSNSPTIPFFGGWLGESSRYGKSSLIARVFGDLFRKGKRLKASWLAKGLIMWVLKTALLGAGLLLATKGAVQAGKRLFDDKSTTETETEEGSGSAYTPETESSDQNQQELVPKSWSKKLLQVKPGFSEKKWANDDDNAWIIDLSPGNGTIEGTLLAWTQDIYPQLGKLYQIIPSFPSFQQTVAILKNNYSGRTPNSLLVPTKFNSRKQIVDTFAKDVAEHVASQISEQIG